MAVVGVLATQAAVQLSLGLLAEAGLAFLGLGPQPPTPSWGRMVADAQTLVQFLKTGEVPKGAKLN